MGDARRGAEMSEAKTSTRVHGQLAMMVALEKLIQQRVEHFVDANIGHPDVVGLLNRARESTEDRRRVAAARLTALAPDLPLPETDITSSPLDAIRGG